MDSPLAIAVWLLLAQGSKWISAGHSVVSSFSSILTLLAADAKSCKMIYCNDYRNPYVCIGQSIHVIERLRMSGF